MLPNGRAMNTAKLSSAADIAGAINETLCYSNGSPIGLKLSLIVNV